MNTDLIKKYPNKYNLTPENIKDITVSDWDKLKSVTWHNETLTDGTWYCKLIGCQYPDSKKFNDEDEAFIGFNGDDGSVRFDCTSYGGMCGYDFDAFYDPNEMENEFDLNLHINIVNWLTDLIDGGVLSPAGPELNR